jgi:hypothetical protein
MQSRNGFSNKTSNKTLWVKLKISVSILCYNYGRFLAQAIESALSQELPDGASLTVLVIDDGSTDETEAICAAFAERIRTIRSANEGFGPSLTKAISLADGDFVFLLDADDYFAPGKIRRVTEVIVNSGALYVDHSHLFVDELGAPLRGVQSGGNTSTICVRREAALPLLPVENEVAFHALLFADRGARIPDPLTYYRVHSSSMTNRSEPGIQNEYLAGVHRRLLARTRSTGFCPAWLKSQSEKKRISARYELLSLYCELEAALERKRRFESLFIQLKLSFALLQTPSQISIFYLKMLVKTLLLRPSFRRG